MKRPFACRLLWLCCLLAASRTPAFAAGLRHINISYEPLTLNGSPLLHAQVNSLPVNLVLDTGTSLSAITDKLATKLGLTPRPVLDQQGVPVLFFDHPLQSVELTDLSIGLLAFRKVSVAVVKAEDLAFFGSSVDGIIGMNTLASWAIQLDFQHHSLSFWRGGNLSAEERKSIGFSEAASVAITPNPDNLRSYAPVRFNQAYDASLVVDTGANATQVSSDLARQLQLKSVAQIQYTTLYAKSAVNKGRVQELSLGNLVLKHCMVMYADISKADSNSLDPTLGLDILRQYQVLLDFPAKRMYLKPAEVFPDTPNLAPDGQTYLWQFRYKQGEVYQTQNSTRITGQMQDQPINLLNESLMHRETREINSDGDAVQVISTLSAQSTTNGQTQTEDVSAAPVVTRVLTKNGLTRQQTIDKKQPGGSRLDDLQQLLSNFPVPDKPVKIGDQWEAEVKSSVFPEEVVTLKSRLIGHEMVAGTDTLKVQTYLEIPKDAAETGFIVARGTYNVDPKQGRLAKANYVLDDVDITTPLGIMKARVEITQSLVLPHS